MGPKRLGREGSQSTHKEGPKDGPWGNLWPKLALEEAPSPSARELVSSVASAFAVAADDDEAPPNMKGLCELAAECASWLHARTMIAISQVLLQPGLSRNFTDLTDLTGLLLRVLAKDSQPCHSSEWVSMAGELQLIGLAHGDAALRQRSAEAAALVRASGDVPAAAELLWVFLTAKALDEDLLAAVEDLPLEGSSQPSAAAALLCGLAQPCVCEMLGARRLLDLASRCARHVLRSQGEELPTASLPRLSLALAHFLQLGKQKGEAAEGLQSLKQVLNVLGGVALRRLEELSFEDLADLAVATAACTDSKSSLLVLDGLAIEAGRRVQGMRGRTMHAGSAVVLRAAVGPAPARSVGLLGEFCLATGRWRVWLEGEGSVGVDARQQDIGLLDGGARPQRCCYTCWRLSSRLWRSADATRYLVPF